MSCAEHGELAYALTIVQSHPRWAYPGLLLGACIETLVPLSLIVPGELVFLCGTALAGTGALELRGVLVALHGGGVLGDNCSHWIGRRCGARLWHQLEGWPLLRRLPRDLELAGALAHPLLELTVHPHVFDGDRRGIGERLQQTDLLVRRLMVMRPVIADRPRPDRCCGSARSPGCARRSLDRHPPGCASRGRCPG